jgi:N-acetyl-anhydromuramyl-L-alanine amidase AmpD
MNKKNTKPKDTRTDEQKESLRVLIDKITKKFPDVDILGHRDLNPKKACPCFDVAKEKY